MAPLPSDPDARSVRAAETAKGRASVAQRCPDCDSPRAATVVGTEPVRLWCLSCGVGWWTDELGTTIVDRRVNPRHPSIVAKGPAPVRREATIPHSLDAIAGRLGELLLEILVLGSEERARVIGRLYAEPSRRALAELLIEL